MYRRDRRLPVAGIVVALAVVATVVTIIVRRGNSGNKPPGGVASDVMKTIPTHGAKLAAEVITPRGKGPAPLVVMPTAWGDQGPTTYRAIGLGLAGAGYQVVAYAQRGFGGSTGKIDFAGPGTQRDASAVITWALHNTRADPDHIAMFGMSYGAGISLLAAAHDPRVKVVAATSTWANQAKTFAPDGTPAIAALSVLIGNHRPAYDQTVKHLQTTLADTPAKLAAALRAISRVRSPSSYVKQLNKNHPAILIANAFEDSIFSPAQLIPFFAALTTPKHLELAAGDHGGPERSALSGLPNHTIDDVRAWLDHYLRGAANGIDQEDPIELKDVRTGELDTYRTWPTATNGDRSPLGAPNTASTTIDPSSTWSAHIPSGTDSGATTGPMQFVPSTAYRLPQLTISTVDRAHAFVWDGPQLPSGLPLRGTPSVRLGLSATSKTATVFLYLYDVTSDGLGTLVDFQPYSTTGLSATKARDVTIAMQPISWSVPSGDHLTLVIDTFDPHYQSLALAGTTVTVSSSKSEPASFTGPSRA
jgi:predicted acyl esterase